jgi:hypothetical protein
MTHLCHRRSIFTVMHNAALIQHDVVGCGLDLRWNK